MYVQFSKVIPYAAGKLGIVFSTNIDSYLCRWSWIRTCLYESSTPLLFWQSFRNAALLSTRIDSPCLRTCLQPGVTHDCTPIVHHVRLNQLTWCLSRAQMLQSDWCHTFSCGSLQQFWSRMLPGPLPLVKGERGLGTRLGYDWWTADLCDVVFRHSTLSVNYLNK